MNIVCLIGRLTREPEIRTTNNGLAVANFTLAVDSGKDKTEFINCVAWDKTANLLKDYFHKGDQCGLTGFLTSRNWEDRDGNKRTSIEVTANRLDFGAKAKSETTSYADLDDSDEFPF